MATRMCSHKRVIEVEYWTCGSQNHHHTTKKIALACIAKQKKRAANANVNKPLDEEALRRLVFLRKCGLTSRELGKRFNKSGDRIRQILRTIEMKEQKLIARSEEEAFCAARELALAYKNICQTQIILKSIADN